MTPPVRQRLPPLLLLLILGLLPRLLLRTELLGEDDAVYISYAHRARKEGPWYPTAHFNETRLGLILPLAALGSLTNEAPHTWYFYNLFCSLGMIGITFYIGAQWFTLRIGILAALLVTFLPMNIFYASVVNADTPAAFWIACAFLLWWPRGPSSQTPSPHPIVRGILGGACFSIALLTRETSLMLLPVLLLWLLISRPTRMTLGTGLATGLALIATVSLYYGMRFGKPFPWLDPILSQQVSDQMKDHFYRQPGDLKDRILFAWPRLMFSPFHAGMTEVGLLYWLLLPALFILFRNRTGAILFLLGWIFIPLATLWFAPSSITPYMPGFVVYGRYLEIITLPVTLAIARAAEFTWHRRSLRLAAGVAYAMVGLLGTLAWRSQTSLTLGLPSRELACELQNLRARTVYMDSRHARLLTILARFQPTYEILEYPEREPVWGKGTYGVFDERGLAYDAYVHNRPHILPYLKETIAKSEIVWIRDYPARFSLRSWLFGLKKPKPTRLAIYRMKEK